MASWAYYLYIKISTIHLQSCKVSRPNLSSNRSYSQKSLSYLKLNSLNCMKKTLNRPLQEMELLQVLRSNYFQSHSLTLTSSPLDLHINSFNIHVFWLIIHMVFVQKTGNLIEFGKCSSTYSLYHSNSVCEFDWRSFICFSYHWLQTIQYRVTDWPLSLATLWAPSSNQIFTKISVWNQRMRTIVYERNWFPH